MAWAKAVRNQPTENVAGAKRTVEENLELANVTELRQNLLPVIDRIEKDPALRILILKHGKPQAVLMSAQTYDLVKGIMNQMAGQLEPHSHEEALENAFQRLRSERVAAGAASTVVAAAQQKASHQIEDLIEALQILRNDLTANQE